MKAEKIKQKIRENEESVISLNSFSSQDEISINIENEDISTFSSPITRKYDLKLKFVNCDIDYLKVYGNRSYCEKIELVDCNIGKIRIENNINKLILKDTCVDNQTTKYAYFEDIESIKIKDSTFHSISEDSSYVRFKTSLLISNCNDVNITNTHFHKGKVGLIIEESTAKIINSHIIDSNYIFEATDSNKRKKS